MVTNTKSVGHLGCPCFHCRRGLSRLGKVFKRMKEHQLRAKTKAAIKKSLDNDGGEELLLFPGLTGYTD